MKNSSSEIVIAVMSDLHCHHSRKFLKDDNPVINSYLTTDKSRYPAKSHPVQALYSLVESKKLTSADYLVCPGDFTNQVDPQGLISGWAFVKEVAGLLSVKTENIYSTLGNHDVDSRFNHDDDVFKLAKSIGNGFPLLDPEHSKDFWAYGFCIVEKDEIRFLILNSVHFHSNEDQAVFGKVTEQQLEQIEIGLSKVVEDEKIQIALFHHHPIDHSRFELGTEDTIKSGSLLVDLLNKLKFDLIIHGHKHDPWLRYSHGKGNSTPIFSAGSFSVASKHMITGSKNTFHKITIKKKKGQRGCGIIETWEYLPNNGWRHADSGEEYFPMVTGFGYSGEIEKLVKKTIIEIEKGNGSFVDWGEFSKKIEEVNFLTPEEAIDFKNQLWDQKIATIPPLPKRPLQIGKLHSS